MCGGGRGTAWRSVYLLFCSTGYFLFELLSMLYTLIPCLCQLVGEIILIYFILLVRCCSLQCGCHVGFILALNDTRILKCFTVMRCPISLKTKKKGNLLIVNIQLRILAQAYKCDMFCNISSQVSCYSLRSTVLV